MGDKHGKIEGEMGRERSIHTQIYIYIYIYCIGFLKWGYPKMDGL